MNRVRLLALLFGLAWVVPLWAQAPGELEKKLDEKISPAIEKAGAPSVSVAVGPRPPRLAGRKDRGVARQDHRPASARWRPADRGETAGRRRRRTCLRQHAIAQHAGGHRGQGAQRKPISTPAGERRIHRRRGAADRGSAGGHSGAQVIKPSRDRQGAVARTYRKYALVIAKPRTKKPGVGSRQPEVGSHALRCVLT
jgi:hypothetical protein